MNKEKYQTAVDLKIRCITKYEMERKHCDEATAYANIIQTEIYRLLKNIKTGLCLEPNGYIIKAYEEEVTKSVNAMYDYINIE